MASDPLPLDHLSTAERIELRGRLRDSLDPAAAAPITDRLAAELDRREAESDSDPEAGQSWSNVKAQLRPTAARSLARFPYAVYYKAYPHVVSVIHRRRHPRKGFVTNASR